jgi:hypothetical protein
MHVLDGFNGNPSAGNQQFPAESAASTFEDTDCALIELSYPALQVAHQVRERNCDTNYRLLGPSGVPHRAGFLEKQVIADDLKGNLGHWALVIEASQIRIYLSDQLQADPRPDFSSRSERYNVAKTVETAPTTPLP